MTPLTVSARILVVEDEVLIAEEISDRLRRLGYEVVGDAATADDALAAARELMPDLILMDIRLRGARDGINAAQRIRNELDVPIVYITAHSDAATLERAKSSFPFGYVLKPFQERDLVIAVEMALQRHGVERQLRESEARYATTLRSIGDGVIATDTERRVTFMNPAAEGITGWPLEQAGGRPVEQVVQFVEERGQKEVEHPIHLALRLREVVQLPYATALIDRGGAAVPVEDSASPIEDAAGDLLGAVMAIRDCTERREAQRALLQTQEKLQTARKMEAVGRLASGVAHDFNNMLTVILGCGTMLQGRLAEDAQGALLIDDILQAARRAAALTDQLLSYGRQRVLEPRVVDLNVLVVDTLGLLRRLAGERIRLEIEPHGEAVCAYVDPGQLERVIVNLVTNARDALQGEPGRITLRIRSREVTADEIARGELDLAPGAHSVLDVRDNGCGMDEETSRRIFEPFFTTKVASRGMGLGLATAYGTIKQSGGHLSVESHEGQGSTFTIHLPAVDASTVPEVPRRAAPAEGGGSGTILLVEDDHAVRRVTLVSLRSHGYTVLDAADAEMALRLFEHGGQQVDLLVTDVVLPGLSGRDLADRLHVKDPGLRVLFLSGHTDDEILRRGLVEAKVDFLRKPFTPAELGDKVREVVTSDPPAAP